MKKMFTFPVIEQNSLYYKRDSRYLKKVVNNRMTICIAAICGVNGAKDAKIVLCTDKMVSSVVQFEGAEAKCKQITPYCYAMHSSEDSRVSDLLLERVAEKAKAQKTTVIKDIVAFLSEECQNYKKELIERDVLFNYNITAQKLSASTDTLLHRAVEEVQNYQFPIRYDFIIAGLEPNGEAHIYRMNQDGHYWCHDSLGYCTIGSGELTAFMELTQVVYTCDKPWQMAIPLIYFAKKAAERSSGVGEATDMWLLHFPSVDSTIPALWSPLVDKVVDLFNSHWTKMKDAHVKILNNACKGFGQLIDNYNKEKEAATKSEATA